MSLNDQLSNALSKILNAEKVHKTECMIPASKTIRNVLSLLQKHQYIGSYEEIPASSGTRLNISLLGRINKCGSIKPRFSVQSSNFEKFEKRYLIAKDFGILIVSTSKGVMVHSEAKKKNIGGKLLAYAY